MGRFFGSVFGKVLWLHPHWGRFLVARGGDIFWERFLQNDDGGENSHIHRLKIRVSVHRIFRAMICRKDRCTDDRKFVSPQKFLQPFRASTPTPMCEFAPFFSRGVPCLKRARIRSIVGGGVEGLFEFERRTSFEGMFVPSSLASCSFTF